VTLLNERYLANQKYPANQRYLSNKRYLANQRYLANKRYLAPVGLVFCLMIWLAGFMAGETVFFSQPAFGAQDISPVQRHGEKISIDVYDADIKNVLRLIREVSGENIIIDPDVTGRVTLSMSHPTPWDQTLDLILKINGLTQTTEGGVTRVLTRKTLAREREFQRSKMAAKQKENEFEPVVTEYIPVNYADAKKEIRIHIEKIITPDRGAVTVDERSNTIIITDVPEKIRQAAEMVRRLDNVTPQVMIEARIVEASDSFTKEIGVQWGTGFGVQSTDLLNVPGVTSNVGDALNQQVGGNIDFGGSYGFNAAMNFPYRSGNLAGIGINFLKISGTPFLLNAKLAAMESFGKGKIISSPKIITLNGKTAIIKQGVAYPYNKTDDAGNTTTEFKNIDLVLKVTPHVNPDARILLDIDIKKNDIDLNSSINNQPSFTTKEAITQLLVDDQDTVVIGGIIKTKKSDGQTGIPFFSRIPVIGWLFKTKNRFEEKEELLIFITPKIIRLPRRNAAIH